MAIWRADLLLGLALLAAGCPAEKLGVKLDRGGPESLSRDDLERDVFLLTSLDQGGGWAKDGSVAAEARRVMVSRLGEMGLSPGFGKGWTSPAGGDANVCGRRPGTGEGATMVLALDTGRGAEEGAAPVAVLISLAKSVDTAEGPHREMVFCRVAPGEGMAALHRRSPVPPEQIEKILILGPMGAGDLEERETAALGRAATLVTTGSRSFHGTSEDQAWRLDSGALLVHVRRLHRRHMAPR